MSMLHFLITAGILPPYPLPNAPKKRQLIGEKEDGYYTIQCPWCLKDHQEIVKKKIYCSVDCRKQKYMSERSQMRQQK